MKLKLSKQNIIRSGLLRYVIVWRERESIFELDAYRWVILAMQSQWVVG